MRDLLANLRKNNIFISLENNNLKLKFGDSTPSKILIEEVKKYKQELIEYLRNNSYKESDFHSIPKIEIHNEGYALSSSQYRLWILNELNTDNAAYNTIELFSLDGLIDLPLLDSSFKELINHHEILRTVFKKDDLGEVKQFIISADSIDFRTAYYDLRGVEDQGAKIKLIINEQRIAPFDLSSGPLLRVSLLQLTEDKYVLCYVLHHIISDGWSLNVMIKDLFALYIGAKQGKQNRLEPLRIQYKDYAAWQQDQLNGESLKEHQNYWLQQFEGALPVLELLEDKARPALKTYNGGVLNMSFSAELSKKLKNFAQENGCTLYMSLLAAVKTLLYRYTQQEDIIIGSPIAGRDHVDLNNQVGCYINTLALRTRFSGNDSFKELLLKVKEVTLGAYDHQIYPFDELVKNLNIKRDASRSVLFDVMVVLQNTNTSKQSEDQSLDLLRVSKYEVEEEQVISKLDLAFDFAEIGDGLHVTIEYNSDIYYKNSIEQIGGHLLQLIEAALTQPDLAVCELDYMSSLQKNELLLDFNKTVFEYPADKNLLDLFSDQVLKTPDHTAIVFEGSQYTYQELHNLSNELGDYLRKKYNIRANDLIGIKLDRSEWMVIAILGVLKSGGAYLPIDPEYPQERIDFMTADSGCVTLLDAEELAVFRNSETGYDKENFKTNINQKDLAYVIYTSGSTGRPKGVLIEHGAVANSIQAQQSIIGISVSQRCLQFFSCSFDVSVFEIFLTLLSGSALHIIKDSDKKNPELLEDYIQDHNIEMVTLPAAYLPLIDISKLSGLKKVVTGGESVSQDLVLKVSDYVDYYNAYGPTESSICTSIFEIKKGGRALVDRVSIGKPIANTAIYILDAQNRLTAKGMAGEICIGGYGLARGYHNNEALTSEKFIPNPFVEGDRMYKTGDLGRWLPDGTIDFLGRIDDQVKIRGYRIELGEIERSLLSCEGVDSAVVIAHLNANKEKELVAYVLSSKVLHTQDLILELNKILPSYMIPVQFVQLDELPLTSNGKIDKSKLPNPDESRMEAGIEYISARNETEESLVEIWQSILSRDKIGIKDDFFESGGHSLKVSQLASRINKHFGVTIELRELFEQTVLEQQAELIKRSLKTAYVSIPLTSVQDNYPVSSAQRRLWLLSQLESGNSAYNMPGVYIFEGELNYDILTASFLKLLNRHEILRTVFIQNAEGEVRQKILSVEELGFKIENQNLADFPEREEMVNDSIRQVLMLPFDLETGPLLRISLFQLSDNKWIFTYVMHHIISDGWSMGLLIKELLELYSSHDQNNPFSNLRIQYKDYVDWQQQQVDSDITQLHKKYWLEQLSGELPVLELLVDKLRPQIKTYNGGSIKKQVTPECYKAIKLITQERKGTLFMTLLGVVNVLLYKYSNQTDIILGTPVAGRGHIDLEDQIGLYLNTLALRTSFNGTDNFNELFENVKKVTLGAYEHQIYPFDALVDELNIQHNPSRSVLFDIMVSFQNNEYKESDFNKKTGLSIQPYPNEEAQSSKFDLTFDFIETGDDFFVTIEYNSDLFLPETVSCMTTHFERLIVAISNNPSLPIEQLDYLTANEKTQLLSTFNTTKSDYPSNQTVLDIFEYQVKLNPDNIAVIFEDTTLTYRQLNEHSNNLAFSLRENFRVKANDFVGIMLDRSEKMIIAVLAVLKSGGAYVPMDPEIPSKRKQYIIEDTKINVLITHNKYISDLDYFNGDLIEIESTETNNAVTKLDSVHIQQKDLAYVIYTSGSTGTIKGVLIEHSGLVNMAFDHIDKLQLTSSDKVLQFMSISFDGSVLDIFMTLLAGATLVLLKKEIVDDPDLFVQYINKKDVSVITIPPAYLRALNRDPLDKVKTIITAGEAAYVEDALHYARFKNFFNGYGPSECTVNSTLYKVDPALNYTAIPIGYPAYNKSIYILNEALQLQSINTIGEICISGVGLASGYLNNEKLTKEKFITNPFSPSERMYKTGDLGRWLSDGSIEFVGRKDDQVKIRGYRIELGEIESVLKNLPEINAAIVIAKKNSSGEAELVAYVLSNDILNAQNLKTQIRSVLPVYMIPRYFVQLDELPITTNGKVDKKALPDPFVYGLATGVDYVAPRNETEEKLISIWKNVLDIDTLGIKENFFEIGGHSLKATRLVNQIHKEFEVKIALKDLFVTAILEDQAQLIQKAKKTSFVDIHAVTKQAYYPLSASQRRLWILSQFEEGSVAYNMPGTYVLEGNLDQKILENSFKKLIERHEILRTAFNENEAGEIRQFILEEKEFKLIYEDLRNDNRQEEKLDKILHNEFNTIFDLKSGSLVRAYLVHLAENKYVFNCTMHHIISDGWSMGVLIKEVMMFYNQQVNGILSEMAPLRIQYKDYAVWQEEQLSGEALKEHRTYWLNQFEGELPVFDLLPGLVRPLLQTYNGGIVYKKIDAESSAGIKKICQNQGATLFMGALALVNTLIYRYNNQEDLIIGTPIAGREHSDLENQIGFYINTLALRTRFNSHDSFVSLLKNIQEVTLGAYEHQIYPFDELVDSLHLQRDMSRNPLFDVMVTVQHNESKENNEQDLEDLQVSPYEGTTAVVSKFDFTFNFVDSGEELSFDLEYNTDIYSEQLANQLANHLVGLIQAVVQKPTLEILQLDYLTESEKENFLTTFNNTTVRYPEDKNVVNLFEDQVAESPDSIALIFEEKELTYKDLNEKSNQFAAYLKENYSVNPNDLIGVELEKNEWAIISILAILKSGGAYVPIDPMYPKDRKDFMYADSGCKLIIDEKELKKFNAEKEKYTVENLGVVNIQSDLAYIIYTSGTTGNPKGVMIEHKSLFDYISTFESTFKITKDDRCIQQSSFSFDTHIEEIYPVLIKGGTLLMGRNGGQDINELQTLIEKRGATVISTTPLVLNELNNCGLDLSNLRLMISGGDVFNTSYVSNFLDKIDLYDSYGPSESTVCCTYFKIEDAQKSSAIGKPINNRKIYILNDENQLSPIGVRGEICIGGAGLARGYLNRPDLTNEKFVDNPFAIGERMYKTGDFGRWLTDGNIQFLGRKDDQVKIRGYRIELGEIETAIQSYEEIDSAAVIAKMNKEGNKELIAYVVSKKEISSSEMRIWLSTLLPSYMIPNYFVQLEQLPLNSSGKINRKTLENKDVSELLTTTDYVAPRNETEEKLVLIWEEILGRERIGVKDNFFDLGGQSIKAIKLIIKIKNVFDINLDLKNIFIEPTIENLSDKIKNDLWLLSTVSHEIDEFDEIKI
ncbi:non-ribosomal peptide synthetase [Flavobacterium sp. N502540]|uniref:non-ribosomal peptide synthetase n=1 Tax=Flavobacterium sp. N502540 TaxID=2986838 RepID=UPI0022246034|nr:non-ribosomal peptide synthetase [Flavobacterium sp. N502540]